MSIKQDLLFGNGNSELTTEEKLQAIRDAKTFFSLTDYVDGLFPVIVHDHTHKKSSAFGELFSAIDWLYENTVGENGE